MKELIRLIGLGALITSFICYLRLFIFAYLNGLAGYGYDVTSYINLHGEAHIEMAFQLISIPFVVYFVFSYLRRLKNEAKNKHNY
jgi:uncharacterized membrane protein